GRPPRWCWSRPTIWPAKRPRSTFPAPTANAPFGAGRRASASKRCGRRRPPASRFPGSTQVMDLLAEHLGNHESDPALRNVETSAILIGIESDGKPIRHPALLVEHHLSQHAVAAHIDAGQEHRILDRAEVVDPDVREQHGTAHDRAA